VWHPQSAVAEETTRKHVDANRARRAEVAWSLALKPEAKIRRAPIPGQRGSY